MTSLKASALSILLPLAIPIYFWCKGADITSRGENLGLCFGLYAVSVFYLSSIIYLIKCVRNDDFKAP